jgi:hypothetical protein
VKAGDNSKFINISTKSRHLSQLKPGFFSSFTHPLLMLKRHTVRQPEAVRQIVYDGENQNVNIVALKLTSG